MLVGRRPEALRVAEEASGAEPPELWRLCFAAEGVLVVRVGEAEGARVFRRVGEQERCRAPEEGARGGLCGLSDAGCGGGGGRCVWAVRVRSWTAADWWCGIWIMRPEVAVSGTWCWAWCWAWC